MPKQTFFNLPDGKREHITQCAMREFSEYGCDKASISRIVQEAGIAKGSFYQYFENKDDLYEYLIDTMVQQKQDIGEEIRPVLEQVTIGEFLRLLIRGVIHQFRQQPDTVKVGIEFTRRLGEPLQRRIFAKYKHLQTEYFPAFIREEKARGQLDPAVDEAVLTQMVLGISYHMREHFIVDGLDTITDEYIDSLIGKVEYILQNGIYSGTSEPAMKATAAGNGEEA